MFLLLFVVGLKFLGSSLIWTSVLSIYDSLDLQAVRRCHLEQCSLHSIPSQTISLHLCSLMPNSMGGFDNDGLPINREQRRYRRYREKSDVNVLDPTVDLDGCLGCRAYSDKRCINMQGVVYTLIL